LNDPEGTFRYFSEGGFYRSYPGQSSNYFEETSRRLLIQPNITTLNSCELLSEMFRSGASKEEPFRSQPTLFGFFEAPETRDRRDKRRIPGPPWPPLRIRHRIDWSAVFNEASGAMQLPFGGRVVRSRCRSERGGDLVLVRTTGNPLATI